MTLVLASTTVPRHRLVIAGVMLASSASANPLSVVPTAGEPGNPIDFFIHVDYDYTLDKSSLIRERVGTPGTSPLGAVPHVNDLVFHQDSHILTPRLDMAVFHDTWLSVALPVTISQSRRLELDRGVGRTTSTAVEDGILPSGGYDANDPGTALPGNLMFRGVDRRGLDQVHVGIGFAAMNQRKDDTKPTWKLGVEGRISVGKIMRFDQANPGSETGVSTGVHELRVWTSVDKKLGWVEPWFELYWQLPIAHRSDSLFSDPGFGSTNADLQQQAGIGFGLDTYLLDDNANGNRVSIDVGAHTIAHFEGRNYSEMWEAFALAGDLHTNGPLVLDGDPIQPDVQALSHPGITNIENYLETRAKLAIRGDLSHRVMFSAFGELAWKTDHAITFADAGIDLPTCSNGATTKCEPDDNDTINPGTAEVNPLHKALIDLVGHRYISTHDFSIVIGVEALFLF